MLREKNMNFF